ncbi:replicative DNA helicase [Candidatus Sordicultor fermentans]|uniref:replicative DNA helicase n=1 Tax=Candidatus Sordicultor fermentans TaxID=1953203 RepID=UPI002A27842B|nr:replicative DNA helicase [Atribacterota bacterium]MDI9607873.1 replicative DNA helicase [Atribacterota bacterium]HQD33293.1 replicative DNA helicase [Candidatus Atribacteria bacterium]
MSIERVPPHDLEAEQATLGSMLLDKEALLRVLDILQPEDFYRDNHRIIFESIAELFEEDQACDIVTLVAKLRQKNQLEAVGGIDYLTQLVNIVPTAANAEYYAHIVEEKSIFRSVINLCTRIIRESYDADLDAKELLDRAQNWILQLSQKKIRYDFVPLKVIINEAFDRIEELYHRDEHVTGVPSGFVDLDLITAGFQPSDFVVVAARPGMGKTSLCLNIAQYVGTKKDISVAIFSLEMSKDQVAQRMLCSEARIDAAKVRKGFIAEREWPELARAAGRLAEANIFVDDTPSISVLELRAKARRLKAEKGLGLVIVDYLQLMRGYGRPENRQQEISEISRSLKAMARELNVPVIAVSQLSRAVEQRTPKRPQLSDLRESGAIEQDADLVLFIYREDYYNPNTPKKGIAEVIVAKQRNGPIGTVELMFQKDYARFENLAR